MSRNYLHRKRKISNKKLNADLLDDQFRHALLVMTMSRSILPNVSDFSKKNDEMDVAIAVHNDSRVECDWEDSNAGAVS